MGFAIFFYREDVKNIYTGQIIAYFVTLVMGIKINLVSDITHVVQHQYLCKKNVILLMLLMLLLSIESAWELGQILAVGEGINSFKIS